MNILKHWKRYLIIGALATGFAVAPVAMAQEATPEPTPIGGEAPSEIPTPDETATDLGATFVKAIILILGSPVLLEGIVGLIRYIPGSTVVSDDALKGAIAGVGIIFYIAAGVFGFTPQFFGVAQFLDKFLPLFSGILGLFFLAPKVRSYAVANRVPVLQQAAKG